MSGTPSLLRSRPAAVATSAGALAVVGVAVLTACGGSSSNGSAAAAQAPSAAAPSGASDGRPGGPAASGLIAAADGSTLQVQSQQDGQVAVTWSAATSFTQQVEVAASTIAAGDCVTAVSSSGDGSATTFTATTIRVTQPVDGSCTGGTGGGGGGFPGGGSGARPSGAPSGMPSGAPSGMPSGAPTGTRTRTGAFASGSVVSVSGTTVVVAARRFDPGSAGAGATSSPTTVNETVTVGADTTITTEQKATSAAATVGRCATAQGTADSTGAVAATSIALTDAVDGACTGAVGGGGFGGPPNGAAGNASGTSDG